MTSIIEDINVLIVDDNVPMLYLMQGVLESLGVNAIRKATTGQEGLDLFNRYDLDIILCDCSMPGFNGFQFAQEIRLNMPHPKCQVPIIMVSGYGVADIVQQARDIGIDEFIVKPFNAKILSERIAHLIENPREFVKSESYSGPDRRRKKGNYYAGPFRRKDDEGKEVTHIDML